MIFGNPQSFAIDTEICEEWGESGIGWFNLLIRGQRYGVHGRDATALGCSFDALNNRLSKRGSHRFEFADLEAALIADSFGLSIYAPDEDPRYGLTVPKERFATAAYDAKIMWAPDGDEAFDDDSFVLQFDVGDRVRLIGFRNNPGDYVHDPGTLRDVSLEADCFYRVLESCSLWIAAHRTSKGRNA